jgi:formate dehydrogenase iron-sulfur subunit
VQYTNGIVDFNQEHCIGCQYCVTGCPFNIPKFNGETKKVYKCTLCSDRVGAGLEPACIKSCPTGCLHFGSKEDMLGLANERADQIKRETSHKNAGVYDPSGVGGTHVIYVLHDKDKAEQYGGLPQNPTVPFFVKMWKGPLKWLGGFGMAAGVLGVFMHYIRFGPKEVDKQEEVKR